MIVAAGSNAVIGVDNGLPWRIPGDLRRFKELTLGGVVIMGRATHESIGRPLPNRLNVVMTRRRDYAADDVEVVHDAESALELAAASGLDPVYVIGGGQIYEELLPQVSRIDLTVVAATPAGDTRLDPIDPSVWMCVEHSDGEGDPPHRFHTLERTDSNGNGLPCLPAALVAQSA